MKNKRLFTGLFALVLFFSVLSQAKDEDTIEITQAQDPIQEMESLLFHLYNGMVTSGYLNAPKINSPFEFWSQSLMPIRDAIQVYLDLKNKGLFITKDQLYEEIPNVLNTGPDLDELALDFGDNRIYNLGPRPGIPPDTCQEIQLTPQTENLSQAIIYNATCRYAHHLYNFVQTQSSTIFFEDINTISGVIPALEAYFEGLRNSGLIENYSVLADRQIIYVKVPLWANGDKSASAPIIPCMVNYFSAQDDAENLKEILQKAIEVNKELVYLTLKPSLVSVLPVDLIRALNAAIALGGNAVPKQKRDAFMQEYGYMVNSEVSQSEVSLQRKPLLDESTHYPAGLVTPANRFIAYFQGYDYTGAFTELGTGIPSIGSSLTKYGYRMSRHLCGKDASIISCQPKQLVWYLRNAQTLLLDVHGEVSGVISGMCYPNIEYGPDCCEKLKQFVQAFGLSTEGIDCNQYPVPEVYRDKTYTVFAESTGVLNCEGKKGKTITFTDGKKRNRCHISFGPDIYKILGEKAAVFTAQCYGESFLEGFYTDQVMDYWSCQPGQPTTRSKLQHDTEIIRHDLVGENQQYLVCMANPPILITGPFCLGEGDEVRGFNWQRVVNDSVIVRGSKLPTDPISTFDFDVSNGNRLYWNAYIAGRKTTSVEFAPSIKDVFYKPESGEFIAEFTSKVKADEGKISVIEHNCPRRLASAPKYQPGKEPKITESEATFTLNAGGDGYSLMSDGEWGSPPEKLRKIYGHDQSDWPWYIQVIISGVRAHWLNNPVGLDGNTDSLIKEPPWVWPNQFTTKVVPPMYVYRGRAPDKDSYEVWLPARPPLICCFPNVVDNGSGGYKKNGCICSTSGSIYTNPREHPGNEYINCYVDMGGSYFFPGTPVPVWHECCHSSPCVPGGNCGPFPKGECPQYRQFERHCPSPPSPPGTTTIDEVYYYRQWPTDEHNDQPCPKIKGCCLVEGESSFKCVEEMQGTD